MFTEIIPPEELHRSNHRKGDQHTRMFEMSSGEKVIDMDDINLEKPPGLLGKKTGNEVMRVPKVLLEQAYIRRPVVFNIVNKHVHGVLRYKPIIISTSTEDKDKLVGLNKRLKLCPVVLPQILTDLVVYGETWHEYIYERKNRMVIKLDNRDPKFMDISRVNNSGNIFAMNDTGCLGKPLVDDKGDPEYYVQYLDSSQKINDIYKSRKVSQCGKDAIKFNINELLHITLFTVGDSYEGLGVIEPMYNIIKNKGDVERSITHAILRIGNPLIYALVGDQRVMPSPNLINEVSESIKNANERTGITLPNYVQLGLLQAKNPNKLTENLHYFNSMMVAGSGLPESLATGAGEGSNKHTLEGLMISLEGVYTLIRERISDTLGYHLLPYIQDNEGFKGDLSLYWQPPKPIESQDDQSKEVLLNEESKKPKTDELDDIVDDVTIVDAIQS